MQEPQPTQYKTTDMVEPLLNIANINNITGNTGLIPNIASIDIDSLNNITVQLQASSLLVGLQQPQYQIYSKQGTYHTLTPHSITHTTLLLCIVCIKFIM